MKNAILFFLLASFLASCGNGEKETERFFSGRALSIDGKPIANAKIKAYFYGDSVLEAAASSDSAGFFKLKLPNADYFEVEFIAPAKQNLFLELFDLSKSKNFNLKAIFPPKIIKKRLDEIYAVGNFNNFSPDSGIVYFQAKNDSTFETEIPFEGDTLFYKIMNADVANLGIIGTQSDGIVFDGKEGFNSFIINRFKKKKIKIIFEPKKMKSAIKLKSDFTSSDSAFNQYLKIYKFFAVLGDSAKTKYFETQDYKQYYEVYRKAIKRLLARVSDIDSRALLINYYFKSTPDPDPKDSALARELKSLISPRSSFWEENCYILPALIISSDGSFENSKYFKEITTLNKNPKIRERATFEAFNYLLNRGLRERAKKYLLDLIQNYPNGRFSNLAQKIFVKAEKKKAAA